MGFRLWAETFPLTELIDHVTSFTRPSAVQAVHLNHLWPVQCSGLQGCSVSGLKCTEANCNCCSYSSGTGPPHPASEPRETLWTREQLSVLPAGAAQVFPEPSAGAWRCASSLKLKFGAPLCCGLTTPPHLHQVSSASIHNVLMKVCVCGRFVCGSAGGSAHGHSVGGC